MSHIKQVLMAIVMLFAATANAGWVDKQGDKVPDSDHMKSAGSFIAQLVITDNETLLLKNWRTLSESVYLPTGNKIERNKIITAFIVFGGCAVDPKGNCDLRMQITVYQPDGTLYAKLPVMEVWTGKPVPPNRTLGLSVDYMRVIIEPGEQLGKYKIDTRVMDKIAGNSMLLSSYFTAVEATE